MILKLTRIRMLAAASFLALPAAAGAQSTDADAALGGSAGAQTEAPLPSPTPPAEAAPEQTVPDVVDQTVPEAQEAVPDAAPPAEPAPAPDAGVSTETSTEMGAEASQEAPGQSGTIAAATAADVQTGATVLDTEGGTVGTIESVEADGAVIATGNVRAKLPITSFGKNDRGLVISLTRAQLEAAASQQDPT